MQLMHTWLSVLLDSHPEKLELLGFLFLEHGELYMHLLGSITFIGKHYRRTAPAVLAVGRHRAD